MIALFVIPNLYRFSPDMINNHKFFNFFLILGNMFSAYAVTVIVKHVNPTIGRTPVRVIVGVGLIGMLTLSGVIDLFPIINDTKGSIADVAVNPDAQYIQSHTEPTDVILNSTWFYHPASLAGRSIFSGYTYFTWSYGYDQITREQTLKNIYAAPDIGSLCALLTTQTIRFVELNPKPESYVQPNLTLWDSLTPAYENSATHLKVFDAHTLCQKGM